MITRTYTLSLLLFPPAFRSAFAECMAADFADGLRDAQRSPHRGFVVTWLVRVAWDLARTILWQWLRTGVPVLTTVYAFTILMFCEQLSTTLMRSRTLRPALAAAPSDGWTITVTVEAVLVVSALTFVLWFLLPQLRRDSPRSLRA